MKNGVFGLIAVAGLATVASASSMSATFTSFGTASFTNKASLGAQGNILNSTGTWTAGAGGTVNAIRVTGNLTDGGIGTYANEARVRMSAGAGNAFTAFNFGPVSSTTTFSGTLPIGPTQFAVTPFTLAAGDVNMEWFESYNDGADSIDSTWDDVSYEFGNGSTTVTNGGAAVGALNNAAVPYTYAGSHVSGGLDFFTFTIGGVSSPTDYLNIRMNFGAVGGMNDTEIALYDNAGNLVVSNDDIGGGPFYSQLSFGADPIAAPGAPGIDGLTLPAGSYTLVTAGYNTTWGATIGAIVPGTNVGTYDLSMTYSVPAPSALALLGLGGLVATRRRR